MMKRIVSMLLCALMVVGAVAPCVSAAQPVSYGNGLTSDDIYFGEGANVVYNEDGSFTVTSSEKPDSGSSSKTPEITAVPEELGQASATVGSTTVDALGVPKDSSLTIQEAKPETESAIDQVVADQDGTSSELFRYDISVQDKNGLDWQPNGMVRLELDAGQKLHKNQKVYVVHVSDDGEAERIDARVNAAGKIEFETEGFSTFAGFTVDFEYENAKFSINGLTSILLSEVFQKLNAPLDVEDVKDVTFTDYSLISIEKQGADWMLTSLKAFDTTEALTLTMNDGKVYEIKVTDAITTKADFYAAYYGGGAYQYIDGYTAGGNAVVQLFLDSDGYPQSNDSAVDDMGDFDTQPLVIDGRDVGGCMEIVLQKESGAGNNLVWDLVELKITGGAKVIIRLGASFTGTETITINSVRPYTNAARPLFNIDDGSLYFNLDSNDSGLVTGTGADIQSTSSVKQIIFDGNDLGANASVPLIYHHRGVDETDRQNIVIRGVTFRDAKHRAVLVQTNNMNNLIFRDCTFSSTVRDVDYGGGAIYIDGITDTGSNVVDVAKFGLYNCTFSGNTGASGHGGAIACYGDVQTLDIDGCKFENCTSANRGGAIEFSVNTKTQDNNIYNWFRIKDTTFSNCTASSHGGAIDISNGDTPLHLASNITITGCTFTDCKATQYRGGAIRMVVDKSRNLTITNSGFSGCTAGSMTGGISVQGTIGNISISGGKTDTKTGEFYTFRECTSSDHGGAFAVDTTSCGNFSASGATFVGNTCSSRGAGVAILCPTVGNITLTSSTFKNNTAGTLGGGFFVGIRSSGSNITAGAVSVTGCTFSGNTAGGVGGALSFTDGTYASFDINTNTFTGNYSANFGGAIGMKIYAEDAHDKFQFKVTGNVSITDNTFKDNGAGGLSPEKDEDGNLLTWDHDSNPTTAEIQKLNGTGGGAAICIGGTIGGTITIKDTTKDDAVEFENCYTWNNGGAICILGDLRCKKIDILNVDMYQCKARDAGNAFYISNAIVDDLLMENCTMKECTYFEPGCGIEIFPSTYASLGDDAYAAYDSSGTFRSIGNTTCRAVIRNCTFYKNESYSNGGGVYWNANDVRKGFDGTTDIVPSLKIYGGSFQGNTAVRDGGAIYCEAEILVDGTQIFENEARQGGGIAQQVYNNPDRPLKDGEKTKVTLSSTTNIYNNKAIETAMVYDTNGNPIYSGGNGGGISIMANATSSLNNTVEPGQEGWIQHYVQFQLNGASLYNNTADHNGGGLYFLAKDATDGESAANIAEIEGYIKQIIIDGGSIYSNTAGRKVDTANGITASNGHGGGIYMKSSANTELLVSDGDIYKNTCYDGNGGGIYLTGKGALCTITGGTIGGDTEDKANAAVMNTYLEVQTKGCGGGIAIDGGATIIMRRPWKVNAQGQYLDKNGAVTNDPTQYVEDETKAGGTIAYNRAHIQGAGIWLNNMLKDASDQDIDGTQNTIVINGGTIKNNVITAPAASSANGGGVYVGSYGSLTMNGGSIIDCEAKGWGGGVYCQTNASFTLNGGNIGSKDHPNKSAGGGGGGIAFQGSGTCTINGGTIAYNESTGNGGGIYMNFSGTVSITGGNVEYNKADLDGGGIYSNEAQVTISNGSVKGNSAVGNGGGIYIQDASTDEKKAVMSGGNIESNTAANGAGAYLTNSKMEMSGGDIKNNTATTSGGGAYLTNAATITVEGNISTNHANNGYGGGVYLTGTGTKLTVKGNINGNTAKDGGGVAAFSTEKVEVSAGNIYDNTASSNGGGIYSDNTEIDLQGTLRSNTATGGNGGGAYLTNGAGLTLKNGTVGESGFPNTANSGDGGGIYATGSGTTVDIQGDVQYNTAKNGGGVAAANGSTISIGGTITGNNATSKGGGVYGTGTNTAVTVTGNINANDANIGGGAAIESRAQIEVKGGQISDNESVNGGGGIYVNAATVKLVKDGDKVGTISNNTSNNYGGGGIYAEQAGTVVEIAGNVTGNHALNTGGAGGGIYMTAGVTLTLTGNVTGNDAAYYGGGIHINGGTNTLSVDGNVNGNHAGVNGGGIHIAAGTNTVTVNQTVNDNTAANDGGGIWASGSNAITVNNAVNSNEAGGNGGGIYAKGGTIILDGNLLSNQATSGNGGGAYVMDAANLTITGSVHHNTATNSTNGLGGGIYATGTNTVATVQGGGNIYENQARNGGGVACRDGGKLVVSGGNVQNNTANSGGGGIHCFDGMVEINSGNIQNNYSKEYAGGMYVGGASTATVDGSVLNNVTDGNGGGIHCASTEGKAPTLTVIGNVEGNKAVTHGGGIYAKTNDGNVGPTINIVGGSITLNYANCVMGTNGSYSTYTAKASKNNGYGGGVYISDSTLTLAPKDGKGGLIAQNSAVNGGGIYAIDATITITGSIEHNMAEFVVSDENKDSVLLGLGGGVCAYSDDGTTNITLNGNIQNNTAQVFGGGAYLESSATSEGTTFKTNFTLTNGYIQKNVASGRNGGGLLVSGNAIANINGGNIINNDAINGYGGGVHAFNGGHVVITGGSITGNEAIRGGGVAAEINAYVEFTNVVSMTDDGGNLSNNKATLYGGGIYAEASTVKVSGGTISGNTAKYGGGIAAFSDESIGASGQTATLADVAGSVTVEGGAVSYNYAEYGGGIFAQDEETLVVVRGGIISNNQARSDYADPDLSKDADGSGGGIYVYNASVQVNKPNSTAAAGEVKANEAARGGGVYVTNSGELTVMGGYIIENHAHGDEGVVGTAWHENVNLLGTGGGIFVADGKAGEASTFTLLAKDETGAKAPVAIYGNLADYAADDVFANGVNTDLNVPLVTEMDLAGYPFQPGGWFEDYPINDPKYSLGLNQAGNQPVGDNNVHRYRDSAVIYRVEITPTNLANADSLPANSANTYVCMTLGIPGAIGEEIVMDFGLPTDMELLNNDLVIKDNFYLTTDLKLGLVHPFTTNSDGEKVLLEYSDTIPDGFTFTQEGEDGKQVLEGKYGKLIITYTESQYVLNGEVQRDADGNIIMVKDFMISYQLYDMQFIGVESFAYAVCYDGVWYYASVNIIPATIIHFEDQNYQTDGKADTTNPFVDYEDGRWTAVTDGVAHDKYQQDGDRPGIDQDNAQGALDMDNVYGYDSTYLDSSRYSLGMAMMTTVSNANPSSTAAFTFWGTGFDIISLCSNKSGAIMVTIDRLDDTATETRYLMVDTYYSYVYDSTAKEWKLSTQEDDNSMYQIPVMKVDDLAYGQYWVEIYVGYDAWIFDHGQYGGGRYDFYLDAIRIYNPANDGIYTDSDGNKQIDTIIQGAYDKDGESLPEIEEIRNLILKEGLSSTDTVTGALFIDRFGSTDTSGISNYRSYGPNNEVYLAPGQAIAFYLSDDASVEKVQLAMKALGGAAKVKIYDATQAVGDVQAMNIVSALDMYYDITNLVGKHVVIYNDSADGTLLSITNKKVTHKRDAGSGSSMEGGDFYASPETGNLALLSLNGPVTIPTISTTGASLSYEDEVKYNVYFTADEIVDVVEMGLILFGENLSDGTVDNAQQVIPGYVVNGGEYVVSTNGIPAKQMGDAVYFKVYALLSDGTYAYSDVLGYSAAVYAKNILTSETASAESKALVVALMNYGAEAQKYFGYRTDDLMNSFLTEDQRALVSGYDADSIANPVAADANKASRFTANGGFNGFGATVSFEGAFSINYYATADVDAEVTMYYWTLADYTAADVLTADNATGAIVMTGEGEVSATVSGIAAKEMEDTIYVAMVYEVDGQQYTTGVKAYSLAAYCKSIAAKDESDMQALAQATAIYGSYANAYFG